MDKKILEQLEELQKTVAYLATNILTKDDVKYFATKDDLKSFATKNDLKNLVTKKYFDTKLKGELDKQTEDICGVMTDLFAQTDERKADKSELDAVKKRVTRLEHKVAA